MENTLIQKLETDAQKRSISGEVVGFLKKMAAIQVHIVLF